MRSERGELATKKPARPVRIPHRLVLAAATSRSSFGNSLRERASDHFRGVEARGGWLVLTSARRAFRSHGKNIQNQSVDLPLADVHAVERVATLLLVPNGLRVLSENGARDRFVVSERSVWVDRIEGARRELHA